MAVGLKVRGGLAGGEPFRVPTVRALEAARRRLTWRIMGLSESGDKCLNEGKSRYAYRTYEAPSGSRQASCTNLSTAAWEPHSEFPDV